MCVCVLGRYETRASYDPMQPNFLNTVIKLRTYQTPQRLLQMLKELEFEMGRDPEMDPKDPRIVDLDLLSMFSTEKEDTRCVQMLIWVSHAVQCSMRCRPTPRTSSWLILS